MSSLQALQFVYNTVQIISYTPYHKQTPRITRSPSRSRVHRYWTTIVPVWRFDSAYIMDSNTKGRKHDNWVTALICVVSKMAPGSSVQQLRDACIFTVTEELLCVCINPVSCMMGNDNKTQLSCRCKQVYLSTWSFKSDAPDQDGAVRHPGLTLLWYPEGFCVSRHDLMHDSTELIQHLQALLLPHAGVVESWESWLKRGQEAVKTAWTSGRTVALRWCTFLPLWPRWGWV